MLHQTGHIITSSIEHPSVFNTVKHLETRGFETTYIGSDSTGVVKFEDLSKAVRKDTMLISIMHSNNETGVIQPIEDIWKLAKKHSMPLHVDAAQSIGKSHFTLSNSPADMLTLVPHKFYGSRGIGALYIRCGIKISPFMFGAGHETGLRPGTENIPGIAGFAKACQIAMRDLDPRVSHTSYLREILLEKLQNGIPDIVLNGRKAKSLPHTLSVRIPFILADDLVNKIADQVAISSGSACHSGRQIPSRVLKSMGLSDPEALSSVRLSVGKDNTEEEIQKASEIIITAVRYLKENSPLKDSS